MPNNQQDPYRDFGNLRYQFSPKRKSKSSKKSNRSSPEKRKVKVLNFAHQANMCLNLKSLKIDLPRDLNQDMAMADLHNQNNKSPPRISDSYQMTPLSPGRPRQLAQPFISDEEVKPSYVDYDLSKSQTPGSSLSLFQNL